MQRAFIVRPFGVKQGIDFDKVQELLISPALERARISGDTTQQFAEAGNIRVDMFEQLLVADIVVADISVHNANVFYELGIRHALRARQTVLIRARVTKPHPERKAEDEVPFDLRTDRYIEYDHTNPADCVDALARSLELTQAGERPDSPVFLSLPDLREQEPSRFVPVPRGFREAVEIAREKKDYALLRLLAAEVSGLNWQVEAWRLAGRAQFRLGRHVDAVRTFERMRSVRRDDIEANLLLGTSYQRLGDLNASDIALARVLEDKGAARRDVSEAWALKGRNDKVRWQQQWTTLDSASRRQAALESPHLRSAFENYRKAFSLALDNYYPGLNALGLSAIQLDLIRDSRESWNEGFDSGEEAVVAFRKLERVHQSLAGAVELALGSADGADEWAAVSRADFLFLTAEKDSVAVKAYAEAVVRLGPVYAASARAQLQLFSELALKTARVDACLSKFPAARQATADARVGHVVVFAGHRVDEQGRGEARFPRTCVERARAEIRKHLERLRPDAGIASAANGGDILFHEVCGELGVRTEVRLALPERLFAQTSVSGAGLDEWVDRYWKVLEQRRSSVVVLQETDEMPDWLKRKTGYTVWQRANLWIVETAMAMNPERLTVLALWNGASGDGPGGTQDLLNEVEKVGATVIRIDTTELCRQRSATEE